MVLTLGSRPLPEPNGANPARKKLPDRVGHDRRLVRMQGLAPDRCSHAIAVLGECV